MNEIENGLKELFRSNTLTNIKLGIELALAQGLSWEYLAEKCLFDEWFVFEKLPYDAKQFYPNEYNEYVGAISIFIEMSTVKFQFDRLHGLMSSINCEWVNEIEEILLLSNKPEIIKRMTIFLKLIQDNEYNDM